MATAARIVTVRIVAALLLLAGGAVHLELWQGGYQAIPYVGPLFLANVVLSVALALVVLVRTNAVTVGAGVALAGGSLVALLLSRTVGLLGFMESRWTPDALRTVAAELGVIVALALIVAVERNRRLPALVPARVRRHR